MTSATWRKLKRLGFDESFIQSICCFGKDSTKRYEMRITDIIDLSMDPKDGIFVCYACFNTEAEFNEIYEKLEGFAYELRDKHNEEYLGNGIIDHCLFDELDGKWEMKLTRKEVASVLSDMLDEHNCNSAFIDFSSTYHKDVEKQIEWEKRRQALEMAVNLFSKGR